LHKKILFALRVGIIQFRIDEKGSFMIFSTKKEMTKFKGTPVELSGTELKAGDVAPIVNVVTTELADKQIGGDSQKAQLVIVVPSLDTPTCDAETRRFNEKIAEFNCKRYKYR